MRITDTKKAPAAIGPYSQAVSTGNLLFTSGQIALDPQTGEMVGDDIVSQTGQLIKNLSAILDANNAGFENVVKTTCFLKNMEDFAKFNEVYAEYFVNKPARSCVAVKSLPKDALVEVEMIVELS